MDYFIMVGKETIRISGSLETRMLCFSKKCNKNLELEIKNGHIRRGNKYSSLTMRTESKVELTLIYQSL